MHGTQLPEYDFAKLIWMLKDSIYQKKPGIFLKVFAPNPPKEDSVYDKLEFNLTEKLRWEVPPEEDN